MADAKEIAEQFNSRIEYIHAKYKNNSMSNTGSVTIKEMSDRLKYTSEKINVIDKEISYIANQILDEHGIKIIGEDIKQALKEVAMSHIRRFTKDNTTR